MIAAFNFFLGLPIIAVGVFDQDVTRKYALRHPEVSEVTRRSIFLKNFPPKSLNLVLKFEFSAFISAAYMHV
jgi:hypothetical protein